MANAAEQQPRSGPRAHPAVLCAAAGRYAEFVDAAGGRVFELPESGVDDALRAEIERGVRYDTVLSLMRTSQVADLSALVDSIDRILADDGWICMVEPSSPSSGARLQRRVRRVRPDLERSGPDLELVSSGGAACDYDNDGSRHLGPGVGMRSSPAAGGRLERWLLSWCRLRLWQRFRRWLCWAASDHDGAGRDAAGRDIVSALWAGGFTVTDLHRRREMSAPVRQRHYVELRARRNTPLPAEATATSAAGG